MNKALLMFTVVFSGKVSSNDGHKRAARAYAGSTVDKSEELEESEESSSKGAIAVAVIVLGGILVVISTLLICNNRSREKGARQEYIKNLTRQTKYRGSELFQIKQYPYINKKLNLQDAKDPKLKVWKKREYGYQEFDHSSERFKEYTEKFRNFYADNAKSVLPESCIWNVIEVFDLLYPTSFPWEKQAEFDKIKGRLWGKGTGELEGIELLKNQTLEELMKNSNATDYSNVHAMVTEEIARRQRIVQAIVSFKTDEPFKIDDDKTLKARFAFFGIVENA